MAWESSRPVPWRRLIREWLIYVAIASVAFVIIFRDKLTVSLFAGLFVSGPMYLLFGAVLAKFGYSRKTFKDLRVERENAAATRSSAKTSDTSGAVGSRPRPAPTKRTSTGPSQQRKGTKPKRR
ncbi:unannotated protein [freshwater metagenome]|uniref:Unannotated protein n=1 Tax=freshwater metagenome TaxID=449393 RepID=A0A6J7EAZ9_9ZZZZ|nr:hypothetical protein [Actinomycetota bacterium]